MIQYQPLEPREWQIMAARPFGSVFVERIRGTLAQNGAQGLTTPNWEAMIRAFVLEMERNPSFQNWGTGSLEPIHRAPPKMRQVAVQESMKNPRLPTMFLWEWTKRSGLFWWRPCTPPMQSSPEEHP